jgi:hypothetical protein
VNDYGDMPAAPTAIEGHFIAVPTEIATGKKDGHEVTTADFPLLNLPNPPSGVPNGPQWVLEAWSNKFDVFQFIRIEDLAYDRTHDNVVYFADTGEPRALPDPATGRLRRGPSQTGGVPTEGPYPNGRLFKLLLDPDDPLGTAQLSILPNANFDLGGYRNASVAHQPDNVETTANAIYFQEDPGGHQQFAGATNARIWRYDLTSQGPPTVVAEVDQSLLPTARPSSWESSGIVDASAAFGPGAFLVDVQAHGLELAVQPAFPNWEYRREGGQLLLIRVPNP